MPQKTYPPPASKPLAHSMDGVPALVPDLSRRRLQTAVSNGGWASRTGLYWEKTEADAFGAVNTSRSHEPVPLDYRHNPDVVLGCSRRWALDGAGGLLGTFDVGSHPAAQYAARAAQRGDLGLSMSVRFRTRWLAHRVPDEWNPTAGVLDVCVRDAASVVAVALTPAPTYPRATVKRVW